MLKVFLKKRVAGKTVWSTENSEHFHPIYLPTNIIHNAHAMESNVSIPLKSAQLMGTPVFFFRKICKWGGQNWDNSIWG